MSENKKELKYLLVVNRISDAVKKTLEECPRRGGFYNWLFMFKGDIVPFNKLYTKNLEEYDVIAVNMSPVDMPIIPYIREKLGRNSKTKLVLNNDYVTEVWGSWNFHPKQYWMMQQLGDMVFSTEPHQVSHMIDRTKTIPHPHWIRMLKHYTSSYKQDTYGILFHSWEGKIHSPAIFNLKFKKMFPKISSVAYCWGSPKTDDKRWMQHYFDYHIPPCSYPDYMDDLMRNQFIYEPTSCHTYGRNSVDCAAVGVPMIGSNTVESMRRCFPFTCCDPYDMKTTLHYAHKLMTDEKFRAKVIDYAYESCEYYNYENAKRRFIQALEESEHDKKEYCY